jgi:hypothetical protein
MTTGADVETGVVLGDVAVCASGVVEAATSPLLSSMTTGNVTTAVVVGGAVVTGAAVAAGSSLSVPQETTANTLSPRTMIRRVIDTSLVRQFRWLDIYFRFNVPALDATSNHDGQSALLHPQE